MKFATLASSAFVVFRVVIAMAVESPSPTSKEHELGAFSPIESAQYITNSTNSRAIEWDDPYMMSCDVSETISTMADKNIDQLLKFPEIFSEHGSLNLNEESALKTEFKGIESEMGPPLPPLPEDIQDMAPPKPARPSRLFRPATFDSEVTKLCRYHDDLAFILHTFNPKNPQGFEVLHSKITVPRDKHHICNSYYKTSSIFKNMCKAIANMEFEAHRLIMS